MANLKSLCFVAHARFSLRYARRRGFDSVCAESSVRFTGRDRHAVSNSCFSFRFRATSPATWPVIAQIKKRAGCLSYKATWPMISHSDKRVGCFRWKRRPSFLHVSSSVVINGHSCVHFIVNHQVQEKGCESHGEIGWLKKIKKCWTEFYFVCQWPWHKFRSVLWRHSFRFNLENRIRLPFYSRFRNRSQNPENPTTVLQYGTVQYSTRHHRLFSEAPMFCSQNVYRLYYHWCIDASRYTEQYLTTVLFFRESQSMFNVLSSECLRVKIISLSQWHAFLFCF